METFIQLALKNEVQTSEVDIYIDIWHSLYGDILPLHEFLGMSIDEYRSFVDSESNLEKIIENRKKSL